MLGLLLAPLLLSGCTKFTDISYLNKDVPEYFSARDFVSPEQLGPLGGSIDWFAGRLGYKRADGKFVFTERLVTGTPDLKVVTLQKSPDYHSVIDKGFTANASLPMLRVYPGSLVGLTKLSEHQSDGCPT